MPDNEVQPRSLAGNSVALLAARVYSVAASGVLSIFTVRLLPVHGYGEYSVAMAVVLVVTTITEFGISTLATREIALNPGAAPRTVGTAFRAQLAIGAIGALLLVPIGLALGYGTRVIVLLALGAALVLAQGMVAALSAPFQARRVFHLFSLTQAAQATIALALGVAALESGGGPPGLVVALVLSQLTASAIAWVLLRRRLRITPQLRGTRGEVFAFVKAATTIGITAGLIAVYGRIDVLLVSKLDSIRSAAIYNLPLLVVEMTFLAAAAVATSFFPLLAEQLVRDRDDAARSVDLVWRLFMLGGVTIALFFGAAGAWIVTTIFGDRYRESGDVLAILAAAIPAGFLNYLTWYALLAAKREARRAVAMAGGLVFNVVLNAIAIPRWGPEGAAGALVVSDLAMVAWLAWVVDREIVPLRFGRLLAKPALALVPAAALVALLVDVSRLAAGVAAALAYSTVILVSGYIRREEWSPLTGPLLTFLSARVR